MKKQITYLLFLALSAVSVSAQLSVSTNGNAYSLVNEIVGNNVNITNASINCPGEASGLFVSNNTNLGLGKGILLTTGKASYAAGPNDKDDRTQCDDEDPNFNDPNLSSIEPKATYDGCVLEFDIKPFCNTLQVKYVFGSEEYPEYVDEGFNDAFGFFIWGPNPAGGSYNAFNMARLPNGTPVSIDKINNGSNNQGPCMNCSYYKDNTGGSSIQYDGLTVPLTASVEVSPCYSYHFKVVIADAGDCKWDSGVFLEKGGITCVNSQVPALSSSTVASLCDWNNGAATAVVTNYTGTPTYSWVPGGQTTQTASQLAPGSYTCLIGLQNPCPYTKTVTVEVPLIKGFSYTNTINNIKCPQDKNGSVTVVPVGGTAPFTYIWNSTPFQNTPTANNLGLGDYICNIIDATGCLKRDSVKIFASSTLKYNPSSTSALCNNPTGTASANLSGGVAPFTYSWTTAPIQTASTATALIPANYSVTVTDSDGCVLGSTVTVNNFIPAITFNDSLVDPTCNQKNGSVFILSVSGGTSPYTFLWPGGESAQNLTGLGAGGYLLKVTDANNCPASKKFYLQNYNYLPLLDTKQDVKCNQPTGYATALVLGGTAPISYTWSNGQNTPTATALVSGTYSVIVKDAAGCTNSASVTINNTDDVFNGWATMDPKNPMTGDNIDIMMHPSANWKLDYAGLSNGYMVYDTANVFNFDEWGNYHISYYLTSVNGCKTSLIYDFFVKDYMTLYFPNTFTPNGDGWNDTYLAIGTLVKEFKLEIFDRWGNQVFKSDDLYKGWDGKFNGEVAKDDVYTYKAWALDYYSKQYNFTGHINLIR